MESGKQEGGRLEVAAASEMSAGLGVHDQARELARSVMSWWEDHKYDTTGDYGEWNVYNAEPEFVKKAKRILSGADESEDDV